MIRVVFDTGVLFSAILKPGSVPAALLDLIGSGSLMPCVSPAILSEYRDVLLARPALRSYRPSALAVLDLIALWGLLVEPKETSSLSPDEPDNRFYECAAASNAAYIVTGNSRHFPSDLGETRIVTPRELLNLFQGN